MARRELLGWLDDPSEDRGIRFAGAGDEWDFWSYRRLADLAGDIARGLVASGVGAGDVVSIVQRAGPHFVGTLFGTMAAGATPSPIAPPLTFQDRDVYRDHVQGLVRAAGPALVVADADLAGAIGELAGPDRVRSVDALLAAGTGRPDPGRDPAELALLQFTSGSSGRARGVRVPFAALEANVAAIRAWLRMTPDDPTASWLPVHHDMGLIGCLITPVVNRSDLWLLPSEEFVRNPLRYLRCFGAQGARLTSMPNFGLEYVARRVPAKALEGLDFSAWRAVIVGAERVDTGALERFCALLGPYGLDRRALLPAYGLAEATLAVTGLPLDEEWTSLAVRPGSLAVGAHVETGTDGQLITGCGRPLGDVTVSVVDDEGRPLHDGAVGEIVVRGSSVALGYAEATGDSASLTRLGDGTLRTADAGFLHDGELFVLGRLGDSMKLRGRALFAEDLESLLAGAGVPALRMATLLGYRSGEATVVAVFEQAQQEWLAAADQLLRLRTEGATVVLVDAPRGAIARTSSGKPKRRVLWQAFVDRRLPGEVVTTGSGDA